MLMQIYADVFNCTMLTSASPQTCALGSAIAATVVAGTRAGGYGSFPAAQKAMTKVKPREYRPNREAVKVYDRLYALYRRLHDGFGGVKTRVAYGDIMKELIAIREQQSR
jgi:L-ribulokinase